MVGVKKEEEQAFEFNLDQKPIISLSSASQSCQNSAKPRRRTGPVRRSKAGWTPEEDTLLTELVKKFNGRNWKKIAEYCHGRTAIQCLHPWKKVVSPETVKGLWTKEEDAFVTQLARKYGCRKWSVIAENLPGCIGKQCRERWYNQLDPTIRRDAWTEEESVLIYYHKVYGSKWAKVATFLPGRTQNTTKNHWHCLKKRLDIHESKFSEPGRCEFKPECTRIRVESQNLGTIFFPSKTMKLEHTDDICSTDLVAARSRRGCPLSEENSEILESRREKEVECQIYSHDGIQSDKRDTTMIIVTVEPNGQFAVQANTLCPSLPQSEASMPCKSSGLPLDFVIPINLRRSHPSHENP